jgi:hypothetical protein
MARPRGEVLSLDQTWELAQQWYHDRMRPDFHGRSAEQAQQIFQQVGLHSPAWSLHPD